MWKSVSVRGKLIEAVDNIVSSIEKYGKPRWNSRAAFIEEAVEEKLDRVQQDIAPVEV